MQKRQKTKQYHKREILVREYLVPKRGIVWKLVTAGLALIMIFGAFYFGNLSFALTLSAAVSVYAYIHSQKPKLHNLKIDEKGICIGEKLYAYSLVKFFYCHKVENSESLNLVLNHKFIHEIPLYSAKNADFLQIYKKLSRFVPEMPDRPETTTEAIIRKLKI